MDEAVVIAKTTGGALKVIYTQDDLLRRLAGTALVRVISPFADAELTKDEVAEAEALQLKIIRDTFNFAVSRRQVKAALDLRQGEVQSEVLAAARGCDLLVMPWSGWQVKGFYYANHMLLRQSRFAFPPMGARIDIADKTEQVLEASKVPVLAVKNKVVKKPFGVYYDGSAGAKALLKWAVKTVPGLLGYQPGDHPVYVVVPAGTRLRKPAMKNIEIMEAADMAEVRLPLLVLTKAAARKMTAWGKMRSSVLVK
jgi:hypothetical protein